MVNIKIILVNFFKWIKSEKRLFLIIMLNLSLVSSVIIFLFSFNNQLLIDIAPSIMKDTYGRVYGIKGSIDNSIYDFLNTLNDKGKFPPIEVLYLGGTAKVNEKQTKVAAVNFVDDNLRGYYYDKKYDVTEAGQSAVAIDTEINLQYGHRFNQNTKDISINGKIYNVVYTKHQFDGAEAMLGGVLVLISYQDFTNEIKSIDELKIIFSERLDIEKETLLKNEIKKLKTPLELNIQPKETSREKNYKNEMIIDTIMLFATLTCLFKIYEYIIGTRKDEFVIYRICGAPKSFIRQTLFLEITVMTTAGILIGSAMFLIVWYVNISNQLYFDLNTWLKAVVILFGCTLAAALKIIVKLRGSSLINIKRGT